MWLPWLEFDPATSSWAVKCYSHYTITVSRSSGKLMACLRSSRSLTKRQTPVFLVSSLALRSGDMVRPLRNEYKNEISTFTSRHCIERHLRCKCQTMVVAINDGANGRANVWSDFSQHYNFFRNVKQSGNMLAFILCRNAKMLAGHNQDFTITHYSLPWNYNMRKYKKCTERC